MSAVNSVTPVGGQAALQQLPTKPFEDLKRNNGAASQPLASDTYTPAQNQAPVSQMGPGGAKAAEDYQKIGKLGAGEQALARAQGPSAVQPQEGVNAPAQQNEQVEAVKRVNSPNQIQQAVEKMATKPDAALMSVINAYA